MKKWGLAIAVLYAVVLVALTWPIAMVAFYPEAKGSDVAELYADVPYWAIVLVMGACQFALLSIPVGSLRRPITRRTVIAPLVVSAFAFGLLVAGAIASLIEVFAGEGAMEHFLPAALAGVVGWGVWAFVFFRWSAGHSGENILERQSKLLFRGSVLELLVAVPTHIVARSRDYCCAGVMTFIGITAGIAVMLFSFGPAVYFLYLDRWRRLQRPRSEEFRSK